MNIGKNYTLTSGSMNIILTRKFKNRGFHGAPPKTPYREEIVGYFSEPKYALKKLVQLEVREDGMKDLETICKKMDELYLLIEKVAPSQVPYLESVQ